MAYVAEYQRPYEGGYVNLPSEETPEKAEFMNARDDTIIKIEQFLGLGGEYALLSEAGYSLGLNIDSNYIMTISLKNKAGEILDSKNIDFPIESVVACEQSINAPAPKVATLLGISQSYISRIEKKVIKRLKTIIKN